MVIFKRADSNRNRNRVALCNPSRVGGGYVKPSTVLMGAGICGGSVSVGAAKVESVPVKKDAKETAETVKVEEPKGDPPPEMPPEGEMDSLPVPQEGCIVEKEPDVQDPPCPPLWIPVNYCESKKPECEEGEESAEHSSGETKIEVTGEVKETAASLPLLGGGEVVRESRRERRRKRKHKQKF